MIDLLNLEPVVISKNLRGKFMLFYGLPKCGKTTLLSKMDHSLIFAFEPGYNGLNKAFVQPVNSWTEFKSALIQLGNDAIKEKFHILGIDTVDIAWDACEKFICQQNQVKEIGDLPYGRGYALCKKEFSETFRQIALMGYGIVFISHSTEKTFKNEKGEDYVQLVPALPTRPYDIVNKLVDIIGYIRASRNPETGESKTYLYLRGDDRFLAGSRFKYIEPKIDFSYDSLVKAIYEAIDKQVELDGGKASDDYNHYYDNMAKSRNNRPFSETVAEAKQLWNDKVVGHEKNASNTYEIIQEVFGKLIKLSEVTESQQDLLELAIERMKEELS